MLKAAAKWDISLISTFIAHFCRLPFNWRTPIGYLIALAAECTAINSATFGFTPVISFFVGSGWFVIGIVKDITNDLGELNVRKAPNNKRKKELKEKFCYILRFYSDARELSTFHWMKNCFNRSAKLIQFA